MSSDDVRAAIERVRLWHGRAFVGVDRQPKDADYLTVCDAAAEAEALRDELTDSREELRVTVDLLRDELESLREKLAVADAAVDAERAAKVRAQEKLAEAERVRVKLDDLVNDWQERAEAAERALAQRCACKLTHPDAGQPWVWLEKCEAHAAMERALAEARKVINEVHGDLDYALPGGPDGLSAGLRERVNLALAARVQEK